MDSEVVEVLREIRDEVKGTNARLDITNARLDHTNARLDVTNMRLESLENRVERGFEVTNTRLLLVETALHRVEESVTKGFIRVAQSIGEIRADVADAQQRITALEKRGKHG